MISFLKALSIASLVLLLNACEANSATYDLLDPLPVPNDALDVRKLHLGASQDNQQLYFSVHRKYPSTDVMLDYSSFFQSQGWEKCEPSVTRWESFLDSSDASDRLVHRTFAYFIRADDHQLAAVAGHYYSTAAEIQTVPDNDEQHWSILIQRNVDTAAEISRLSLNCNVE